MIDFSIFIAGKLKKLNRVKLFTQMELNVE